MFTGAGIVKVFCHIHSHMSATILVLDHEYFATPDVDGSYRIQNVPPGHYTIVGWHERVGERSAEIAVEARHVTVIDLMVPVESIP